MAIITVKIPKLKKVTVNYMTEEQMYNTFGADNIHSWVSCTRGIVQVNLYEDEEYDKLPR